LVADDERFGIGVCKAAEGIFASVKAGRTGSLAVRAAAHTRIELRAVLHHRAVVFSRELACVACEFPFGYLCRLHWTTPTPSQPRFVQICGPSIDVPLRRARYTGLAASAAGQIPAAPVRKPACSC
jgi:hypothetical protein